MTSSRAPDWTAYAVSQLEIPSSPRLLVYRAPLERNVKRMRALLENIAPGSGFRHLCAHAKTHKSAWVTRILLEHGVERFKCTPNELDFLLEAGVRDVFVAYPLLARDADRLAAIVATHDDVRITAQVGCEAHAERLGAAARRHAVEMDCLIDVDVGNRRTGIRPDLAPELARSIAASPRMGALRIRGIHAYDGHNSSPDPAEREAVAVRTMDAVVECVRALEKTGVRVERIVTGGTPGSLLDLRELLVRHGLEAQVEVSPGTWVYWDTNYDAKMPGLFELAALIFSQVMDLPGEGLATLNLGYKRWAIDQGPIQAFSVPGLEVTSTSEEHTVVKVPAGTALRVEDPVLLAPRHVCSTVNLWESFTVIGPGGRVESASLPVSGRNR